MFTTTQTGINETDNLISQLQYIPAGTFIQGSTMQQVEACVEEWAERLVEPHFNKEMFRQWIMKEYPAFKVELNAFYLGKYPVTNDQYALFLKTNDQKIPESIKLNKPGNHPVWGVNAQDVRCFNNWLNRISDKQFRLPSEAEWEYAARGPQNNDYPFGNVFNPAYCNTLESGIGDTSNVDKYESYASGFGICDMAGNVEELTSSDYIPYAGGQWIEDDLYTAIGKTYPVLKGGSFYRGGDLARCARRHGPFPSEKYKYIGFRIAADIF